MTIAPWTLLALAIPVLILGEFLIRRIRWLARFDLPASIVGGLTVAVGVLLWNVYATPPSAAAPTTSIVASQPATTMTTSTPTPAVAWKIDTDARWWTWAVTNEREWWGKRPSFEVYVPFSTAFFTCLGLSASWRVVRAGSWQLLLLLALATGVAVLQNVVGVMLARGLGQHPVLGLLCGGVTLTGGLNTAIANDGLFRDAGFANARVAAAAAVMFGVVTASLFAGAAGGALIRMRRLASGRDPHASLAAVDRPRRGFFDHLGFLARSPGRTLGHLLLLLVCVKAGAWLAPALRWSLDEVGLDWAKFPVYLPSLLVGIVVRNVIDLARPTLIDGPTIERIGGVALGIFLVAAITSLNLLALKSVAGAMLLILTVQVVLMIGVALLVTFLLMGRDYDAALMSAGHIGFGLGMTTNAIATMDVLAAKFGPSPRAFLVISLVGGFLIDITNSIVIGLSMRFTT